MKKRKRFKKILPSLRLRKHQAAIKPGTPPGTVEHIGEQYVDEIKITIHDYSKEYLTSTSVGEVQNIRPYLDKVSNTWIAVNGLHDTQKLRQIWDFFDIHPLIQEDIVNTTQHPKIEVYENCIFFVLRLFSYSREEKKIKSEQISVVLGENFILSFQETDLDHFKPILNRLSQANARLRRYGIDFLAYALVDTVVDYYFGIIGHIANDIESLEDELLYNPQEELLEETHKIRREITYFRKSVWPLREAVNTLIREETHLINEDTKIYFRDVYDHIIQTIDSIEHYRDVVLGLHDMYMSYVGNKMNEVMKVLTVIATIFIPLTFIAGIYGMNFNPEVSPYNMPELSWYWGYPLALVLMAGITGIMIFYFKKKGWF